MATLLSPPARPAKPWRSSDFMIASRNLGFSSQIGYRPGLAQRFTFSMPVTEFNFRYHCH